MFWSFVAGIIRTVAGPLFEFLNKRVDADAQIHISDNTIVDGTQRAIANADDANARIRMKEGPWSPWVVVTIFGFMAPFAFHTWQVVLDSSAWHLTIGPYFIPQWVPHRVGSWGVARLPGLFETTEHAVIQSLFIGAGAAVGALPILHALRRWRR